MTIRLCLIYNYYYAKNIVVSRKRPLEESAEEATEKCPRLESNYASGTNSTVPHSVDTASNNPLMKHGPKLPAFYTHQPEVPEGTWVSA